MKCNDIQELFGVYFDLPDEDLRRKCVDEHILRCKDCSEEFEIWLESTDLIRSVSSIPQPSLDLKDMISNRVMSQIYENETWRIPVSNRMYNIPYKLRRNLTAVIAFCLALFMFSFLLNLVNESGNDNASEISPYGITQVASASNKSSATEPLSVHAVPKNAVASTSGIMEPLKISTLQMPNYWLALSLLGLISALLIMNWFSRTKT